MTAAQGLLTKMMDPRSGMRVKPRQAWLRLVTELLRSDHLRTAGNELMRGQAQARPHIPGHPQAPAGIFSARGAGLWGSWAFRLKLQIDQL